MPERPWIDKGGDLVLNRGTVVFVALLVLLLTVSLAYAGTPVTTHWTTPVTNADNPSSHANNPGHLVVNVGSPLTSQEEISSGGRFHDGGCLSDPAQPCRNNHAGSDWALDIAVEPNHGQPEARLILTYGGVGSTGNPAVNINQPITVKARLKAMDAYRSDQACQWQQWEVLASYSTTDGSSFTNLVIGNVWMAHLTQWSYTTIGAIVGGNAVSLIPGGTGQFYGTSVTLGKVYDGVYATPCSYGKHLHIEVGSTHNWGYQYEWHSAQGPDGYPGFDPENYCLNNPALPPNQGGCWKPYTQYPGPDSADFISSGRILGGIGGNANTFWMRNNPYNDYH